MTGFGRGNAATNDYSADVELSGVNRKQLEIVIQGIRDLPEIETSIRKIIGEKISRGRVAASITLSSTATQPNAVEIDTQLAQSIDAAFARLSADLDRDVLPSATDFLRAPGVVTIAEQQIDPSAAWQAIEPALLEALSKMLDMRQTEGAHLIHDVETRIESLESLSGKIAELAPARPARYREMLFKRLAEADLELDLHDERVAREVALVADRCDISEELTRLAAHFDHFRKYLERDEPIGRSLDFLCQELNREWNTIGSKAADAAIAQHIVTAKAELEKIREQVQNLE